jgi:hypothetical protein
MTCLLNGTYVEPGAGASDDCGGAVQVTTSGSLNLHAVGTYVLTYTATDLCGNSSTATRTIKVSYPTSGTCIDGPTHAILPPINTDGTSVCKQGSTVPAKFRVCDANGVSVGTPGVVTSFKLIQIINGTTAANVNEPVDSTTPDNMFRWTGDLWIFNISTKTLSKNKTYVYLITLNDGSTIQFQFGLK